MDNFHTIGVVFTASALKQSATLSKLNMDNIDLQKLWNEVLSSLKVSISPANFSTWFAETFIYEIKKIKQRYYVDIGCKSNFAKNTIETRYLGLVYESLSKALNNAECDIVFSVRQNPILLQNNSIAPLFQHTEEKKERNLLQIFQKAGIRPYFSFDNFAVSSSNQMAWAAAEAVSKNPGSAYNPLFIWGGVGVGKTHLMNAVGHYLLSNNPDIQVLACTGEQFTNDIVEGIRNKTTQSFRNKYRKLNTLLIDDIQFIAGKDAVQEEFFHTFNALVASGSQIILTSDKPPSDISKLEERLRSRFEAGLIVDIAPPDFELRCAIVQIKSKERGIEIPSDIVHLIAGNLESPRKIEGFLTRLISEINIKNTTVSKEMVENLLQKGGETNGQTQRSPDEIIDIVCKHFSLSKRAILGSVRSRSIARPRQILMYLLRTNLHLPLEEIGRLVGNRDHTTVMHAVEKITTLASSDVYIRESISGIKSKL